MFSLRTQRGAYFSLTMLCLGTPAFAEAPAVRELRVQRAGETTYFHVVFDEPVGMAAMRIAPGPYPLVERRGLGLLPQLVPQDGRTTAVYQRLALPHYLPDVKLTGPRPTTRIEGLEFVGKVLADGKARLLLCYPTRNSLTPNPSPQGRGEELPAAVRDNKDLSNMLRPIRWVEAEVELDFSKALLLAVGQDSPPVLKGGQDRIPIPTNTAGQDRNPILRKAGGQDRNPIPRLQTLWAEAQAARLAVLEAQAPELGFYGFACAATGRKYGVPDPALEGQRLKPDERIYRRMFDLTTGTTSITESLAHQRYLKGAVRDAGPRTIGIGSVRGVTIAEHPWKQMMGDKRPASEPLAKLVPHDNYYIHFKSFRKFLEFGDLLDQWGTIAARAYEANSREYQLKERYERQLCLQSTWFGRNLGPYVVRSLAITGSDPYVREGSDVTILFHVANRRAFLAGVEQFLGAARKEFGAQLQESKERYRGIDVERYVSPLREVSVHRAA
ncbi:MAG: hypothetical protein L0215_22695, partial [Gemmataceae bacterium]|nr:hypothetical protein [Gemmataceae bacterium]